MLLERITPYFLDLAGKFGMKAVDSRHQQGFRLARSPVHRVQGNAAINPRAVIAGKQEVRQGWENKAEGAKVVAKQATRGEWQVVDLQSTEKKFRQPLARQRIHPG